MILIDGYRELSGERAECAYFALLSLEDSHRSQHPTLYPCPAEPLGMNFVDNIIGIGRVGVIPRILGVAECAAEIEYAACAVWPSSLRRTWKLPD